MKLVRALVPTAFLLSATGLQAQVTIADAGPDLYLCSSHAFLQGNAVADGEVGTWTLVAGDLMIVDPTDPASEVVNAAPGVHTLRWTITNGIETTTDQVEVWVYDADAPAAYGGEDVIIEAPQTSAFLQAGPFSWPTTCMWTVISGTGIITEPNQALTTYGGASVGLNILEWTCDNGPCGTTSDQVVVEMIEGGLGVPRAGQVEPRAWYDAISDRIMLELPFAAQIQFVATDGKLLSSVSATAGRSYSPAGQLPAGICTLRVTSPGFIGHEKVLIVR